LHISINYFLIWDQMIMTNETKIQKKKELHAFLFLTAVITPLMAVAVVGGYGLLIWLYQLFTGPPTL